MKALLPRPQPLHTSLNPGRQVQAARRLDRFPPQPVQPVVESLPLQRGQ